MPDLLTRPSLGADTYGSIEAEQYEIHKRHATLLSTLRALDRLPKEPQRLAEAVAGYARDLFDAEAKRYPAEDNNLCAWLKSLAQRVEATVLWRIAELEAVSAAKITHHAPKEEIRSMIQRSLRGRLGEPETIPAATPQAPGDPLTEVKVASAGEVSGAVAQQIRHLRRECRLTVFELAKLVGIAARTVQRHEAGEVDEIRLRHVRQYERVFSETLERRVRLSLSEASR
jgi:DNA-binding XRE family transcriptional regulator